MLRMFVVVDRLHVHAILGTDELKAFRAVIDLDTNVMTLKESREIFPLGAPRVEEMHVTRCVGTHQRLTRVGRNVKIARTFCTIPDVKNIVEICNASLEELAIKRGTALVAATIVPESAFTSSSPQRACPEADRKTEAGRETDESDWIDAVLSSVAIRRTSPADPMPELDKVRETEFEVDFSDSKLNNEQLELFRGLLGTVRDRLVETSLMPGRTDLLEFSIDTGTRPPIKQRPYRVFQAKGDVIEAKSSGI
ncbi:unnamed protein product [Phytophthora fragariaefolia]|uniref:Unnamed protein product n=1 Tax=Phytophthora fragariaefolia TaxID=1490495 RepID=A0A9W6XF54_9STRA|nr:unnamed protein product [Phytophthora fragariaefolia]